MKDVTTLTLDEGTCRTRGGASRASVVAWVLTDRTDVKLVSEMPGNDTIDGDRFKHSFTKFRQPGI